MLVACAGPKVLEMAAETADGVIVSMGYSADDISYAGELINNACHAVNRDPASLDVWWYSEITFADSVEAALELGLPRFSQWLATGDPKSKRIPEHLRGAVAALYEDAHDLDTALGPQRGEVLVERARSLGIYEWLLERAARLWGRPDDVGARLIELEQQGLERWLLYPNNPTLTSREVVKHMTSVRSGLRGYAT